MSQGFLEETGSRESAMKNLSMSRARSHRFRIFLVPALVVLAAFTMVGFGGDGGSHHTPQSQIQTGYFLDSAVEGLEYHTPTQSGVTDSNGAFSYMPGETVQFSVDDLMLGNAMARTYMTPVDLVPGATDETHPTVSNMARFLMTLDEDGDPMNGIHIPSDIAMGMSNHDIRFDMNPDDFQNDMHIMMMMQDLDAMGGSYMGRRLVSTAEAQSHMLATLMDMADMMDGQNSMMHRGVFLDGAVAGLTYKSPTQSGMTTENGAFSYMDGERVAFYMGDLLLGEARAQSVMTPIHLAPGAMDETDQMANNIARFLQTMDDDGDPTNGIVIPDIVRDEMRNVHLDFDMAPGDFEQNADVIMLMDALRSIDMHYADDLRVYAKLRASKPRA